MKFDDRYGALPLHEERTGGKAMFMQNQRRRMNCVPFLLCLVVPWAVFCMSFACMTFEIHHSSPSLCWGMHTGACVLLALLTFFAWERGHLKAEVPAPSWLTFFAVTSTAAWLFGTVAGSVNYSVNMEKYYDMRSLNSYANVDPSFMRGEQLMDAGVVTFKDGTHLDITRSMGFKSGGLYCVAPIVATNGTSDNVDFWAVGRDCCSGVQADFHCQGYNIPAAKSGLRLMDDADRAFYRLAVQQAEAMYAGSGLRARHPLFFSWETDAPAVLEAWYQNGRRVFIAGVFSQLLLQAFMVAVAAISFSKIGYAA